MVIFKEIAPFRAFLSGKKKAGKSIGFVPTMGALHAGHLSIIEASKAQNDITVCSIYVNPTQFNNANDLKHYPRTYDKDINLLEKVECDVLFYPDNNEMYPEPAIIKFEFGDMDTVMEGRYRPGHFSGVALVVLKLFNIVEPTSAYFGQKDWQQFTIINQLIRELKINLSLICIPTFREADGLAMSSRNMRLTGEQRQHALFFYTILMAAKEKLNAGKPVSEVKTFVAALAQANDDVTLDYFEVAERANLNVLKNVDAASQPIMCIAGFVGDVRLIDNMFID